MSNDGGPAFARQNIRDPETGEMEYGHEGMTLRDYFAGQAEGWGEDCDESSVAERCGIEPCPAYATDPLACQRWWSRADAVYKYMQADAMLAAREQKAETK